MDNETLMTTEPQAPEGADASTQATQEGATAAPEAGQQTAAAEQPAAAPAEQQPKEEPLVPESYEFTAPEGVELLDGAKEAYAEIAKELKLTQEQAQAAFEKLATKGQANQQARFEAIRAEWGQQASTDQEFGGDKLQENLAAAKKALDTFGTPELTKLLNESGLGNHPEVIRVFVRAGKALGEDSKLVTGRQPSGQASDARRLYAASNMNP